MMDTKINMKGLKEMVDYLIKKGVKLADSNINSDRVVPIQLIVDSDNCVRFIDKIVRK